MTYRIVRFYAPGVNRRKRTMQTGLTLEEAQAHCNNPKTAKKDKYFDGYERESDEVDEPGFAEKVMELHAKGIV